MASRSPDRKSDQIGLYVNFLITAEGAVPFVPGTLVYPRCQSMHDSKSKAEVAKLALKSMQCLPFFRVFLNLQVDGDRQDQAEDLIRFAEDCFPSAEILARPRRPSTIEAWKKDTEEVARWFGENVPIVCVYNHDHIFVDCNGESFFSSIREVFSGVNYCSKYLIYSHSPENLAMIASPRGTTLAVKNAFNMDLRCGEVEQTGTSTYRLSVIGYIPSFFVTTAGGLRKIWDSAYSIENYVPRPEWRTLEFPNVSFDVYLPTREYFRHFDGYGHVTTLCRGMALSFSGFQADMARAREHTNPVLTEVLNPTSSATMEILEESYYRIFCDNYLLGIRNSLILAISEGSFFRARDHFTEAFQRFVNAYLKVGIDVDAITRDELMFRLLHRIMSRANELQTLIFADALVYGVQIAGTGQSHSKYDANLNGQERGIRQRIRSGATRLKSKFFDMLLRN